MGKSGVSTRPGLFYGYWIVASAFFMMFLHAGSGFYGFPLFVRSLQEEFGWGRGEIMLGLTVSLLAMAAASPFAGRLLKRYEAGKVIAGGVSGVVISFILLSRVDSLWQFYVGWSLFGLAAAASAQIPATAIVTNWFDRRRGLALGLAGIGVGTGGFVLALVIGDYLIPTFGWRMAFLAIASFNLLIVPVAWFAVKTRPADMGLYPDGVKPSAEKVAARPVAAEGLSLGMVLGTSTFWLIGVCFLLTQFASCAMIQSQVPYLEDIGFSTSVTATTVAIVGLGSAGGKLFFGWMCDRVPPKYAACTGISFQAISIAMLMSIGPGSPLILVWLYSAVLGVGIGHWLPTMSMLTSKNFGVASYGIVFGLISFVQLVGNGTGPLFTGFMYDTMNTYRLAFAILLAFYAIAIPAMLLVKRHRSAEEAGAVSEAITQG